MFVQFSRPEDFTGSLSHYPDNVDVQCPTGFSTGSWDDVRVRFDYYKGRGYLRDLDLQDYIKWEEWWYKYQEVLLECCVKVLFLSIPVMCFSNAVVETRTILRDVGEPRCHAATRQKEGSNTKPIELDWIEDFAK